MTIFDNIKQGLKDIGTAVEGAVENVVEVAKDAGETLAEAGKSALDSVVETAKEVSETEIAKDLSAGNFSGAFDKAAAGAKELAQEATDGVKGLMDDKDKTPTA